MNNVNKRILVSTVSIISALTLLVGSAFAAFTSTATNTGNTFGVGTLTLELNGASGTTTTPLFTLPGETPGFVSPAQTIHLSNNGTLDSSSVMFSVNPVNLNPTGVTGDLGNAVTLSLYDDTDNSGSFNDPGQPGGDQLIATKSLNDWQTAFSLGSLASSASRTIFAVVSFPSSGDTDTDNTFQGASESFSMSFLASQ